MIGLKSSKLIEVFKDGNIVIPMYLLKSFKEMKLELEEFVFLMYLYNKGNHFLFDPNHFAEELNMNLMDVMNLISSLTDKGFITVEVLKNDKGFMEEIVLLDAFYNKLKLFVIDDINQNEEKEKENSSVYEMIEKEFGRTLSSIEYELIKAWINSNTSEELIKEAVKEAVLNGVSNLKYIDKILYEWGKKGFKSMNDVNHHLENREKKTERKDLNDLLDYNWLEEDE